MTDSMKFGPEWLRNLSQDGTPGSSGGGPRYQLAEHRYGREEMLALFDRNLGPPELLGRFKSLYVERLQPPLALAPTAEEETRVWQPRPMPGMSGSRGGGRGGSVDRGRGRGRGSYHPVAYQRSQSNYDEDVGLRINTRADRPWADRNGDTEWNGATSPRKEYNSAGRGSMDNWRRHRAGEDDEGWRTQGDRRPDKWVGRGTSWRDGDTDGSGDRELSRGFDRIDRELRERGERGDRGGNRNPTWNQPRKQWDDDILPEWAMENPSESGGTFDSTGAFHGSDDEHELSNPKLIHSQSTTSMRQQSPRPTTLSRSQTQGSISIKRNIDEQHRSREDPHNYSEKENPLDKSTSSVNISIKTRDTSAYNSSTTTDKSNFHSANSVPNLSDTQTSERDNCSPEKSPPLHKSTPRKIQNAPVTEHLSDDEQTIEIPRSEPFIDKKDINENKDQKEMEKALSKAQTVSNFTQVNEIKKTDIDTSPPDEFARMQEVADDIVAQLMLDEDKPPIVPETYNQIPNPMNNMGPIPGVGMGMVHNPASTPPGSDKWFYRDPQGEVQGPFLATEMAEWFRAGYFTTVLLVRRACDDRYTTLGDLVKMCGGVVPFLASNRLPPLKAEQTAPPPQEVSQYQLQMLQRQILMRQQATVLNKLSQNEHWGGLSASEQNALLMQHMAQMVMPESPFSQGLQTPTMVPPVSNHVPPSHGQNPLMQLIAQMQQCKSMPQVSMVDNHMKPPTNHLQSNHLNSQPNLPSIPTNLSNMPIPNINHVSIPPINLMNNITMGNLNNINNKPMPHNQNISNNGMGILDHSSKSAMSDNDPIQSLLRQLSSQSKTEGGWNNSWGPNPASMWDLQGPKPEMKTEQQILEEQMKIRQEEEAQKKREAAELQQKREMEEARLREEKLRKQAELEEKIRLQKEAEEKRKEEQRRQELERKKLEEKEKKAEEKIRKELEKAKKEAEEKRLRELEEKRRQKELRKQEEERRKEDEARKKMDEEERKKKEEEARIHEENKRRQIEALKKLQDQQLRAANAKAAPWRCETSPAAAAPITGPSLIEIQRLEREKRAEQLKEQQLLKEAREQQAALLKEQELAAATERNAMQLKWANQHPTASKVKSVAEIQAEEQKELAKQAAAERLAAQQRERETVAAQQSVGIWSSAPSLNWTSTAWTSNTGFWDDAPAPVQAKPATKSTTKSVTKSPPLTNAVNHSIKVTAATKPVVTLKQNNTPKTNNAGGKNLNNNNLNKKGKKDDNKEDFITWCTKAMSNINSSVDVPTFIGFLSDIESPYEVKDYIKTYLGESKEATEFSKQFLERRCRFKNQQRAAQAHIDDMCSPAPAVNPTTEFQEGKSKKTKKNKMQKIDARILGFNVTAAQDRINIGERDFGDATNN